MYFFDISNFYLYNFSFNFNDMPEQNRCSVWCLILSLCLYCLVMSGYFFKLTVYFVSCWNTVQIPVESKQKWIPITPICILLPVSVLDFMWTDKLKWMNKSAPSMGVFTMACMNNHLKSLLSLLLFISGLLPKMSILVPFTVCMVLMQVWAWVLVVLDLVSIRNL